MKEKNRCTEPETGALLHAYELAALSPDDTERFEIHLLHCRQCFDEVHTFSERADLLRANATVRQEVAQTALDTQPKPSGKLLEYLWPEKLFIFRPAVLMFIILLLIYPAYRGFQPGSEGDIKSVDTVSLFPSRSTTNIFKLNPDRDIVLSFVYPESVPGKIYILELKDEKAEILHHEHSFTSFDEYHMGTLLFPASKLKPGKYRLDISDPDNASPAGRQIYLFQISY